jgi:hypothetical protein
VCSYQERRPACLLPMLGSTFMTNAVGFKTSIRGEPSPTDDVARIRWVSAEELDNLDFAWEHDREMVREALGSV